MGSRASGVGSDFVIDDGTRKTLVMVVGVTQWDQPPAKLVFLFRKSVRNLLEYCRESGFSVLFFLCSETLKKRAFWVGDRARDPCIYT